MGDIEMKEYYYNKALEIPERVVDAVLDTDTYNEIDDQFALAYMIRSTDRINIKAIYAAPFLNSKSNSPIDGMQKSYNEIHKLLTLMGEEELKKNVYRGSEDFLEDENTPRISDAAKNLATLAMGYTEERPLYVVAIGAITNVASALLINPDIADRIVIVWLGGHSYEWPDTREFNMYQDVAAARIIFDSNAPVVLFPCMGVVDKFTLSGDDLRGHLYGKNELCKYLVENTEEEVREYVKPGEYWSRIIWDVTAVSWLTTGKAWGDNFVEYKMATAPICEYNNTYSFDEKRKKISYVYDIHKDFLYRDMIKKLVK